MSAIIIHFREVSNKAMISDSYMHYALIKNFYNQGVLKKVICSECNDNIDISNEYFVQINKILFFRIIKRILKLIQNIFSKFNKRNYEEILFDFIASFYIKKNNARLLYCSKPLFPICISLCKKRGMNIIVRASVAHPLYNYFLVKNEEIRYKLPKISDYSSHKRAIKLSKVFHESDKILVPDPKIAEFPFNTYRFAVDNKKIIKQKHIYCFRGRGGFVKQEPDSKNQSESLNFISVCHMNLIKGIHYLFQAWEKFIKRYNGEANLFVIGTMDRQIRELYERTSSRLRGVVIRGFIKNPFEKFSYADAFISASISDLGPATIIEAMNFGIPIISSRNCGLSKIIRDGKEGFTYEFNDVVRLSEILSWFALNKSEITKMRNNVINRVKMFSTENYIKEINYILQGYI